MRPWGCPNGHGESRVRDTGRDEDGYVVRRRRCTVCDAFWTTQEVPIDPDAYWTRAHSRNEARLALFHKQMRTCTRCGAPYRYGSYRHHVAHSQRHEAALIQLDRDRARARKYGREWIRKRRAVPNVRIAS